MAYDRATAVNNILPAIVTLTTDQMTGAAADALAAVLHAATVTVERRTFLPMPDAAHRGACSWWAWLAPYPRWRASLPRGLRQRASPQPSLPPSGAGVGSVRCRPRSNSRPTTCLSPSGAERYAT